MGIMNDYIEEAEAALLLAVAHEVLHVDAAVV